MSRQRRQRGGRKALQLCRQVQKALTYALSGCGDDVVMELYVESVEPAPNDKRLLVTVSPIDANPSSAPEPADVLSRLQYVTPYLREEVAASIHRKRVPELLFQYLPGLPLEDPGN